MRLRSVVLLLGESRLIAHVERGKTRRQIEFVWHEKDQQDRAPKHWWSSLKGEVLYQEGEQLRASQGMPRIPT